MLKSKEQERYLLDRNPDSFTIMQGVTEYTECLPVYLTKTNGIYPISHNTKKVRIGNDRFVIVALNEAGHNSTEVDLEHLLEWVANNLPDIYMKFLPENK